MRRDIVYQLDEEIDHLREIESGYLSNSFAASAFMGAGIAFVISGFLCYGLNRNLTDMFTYLILASMVVSLVGVIFWDRALKATLKMKRKSILIEGLLQLLSNTPYDPANISDSPETKPAAAFLN